MKKTVATRRTYDPNFNRESKFPFFPGSPEFSCCSISTKNRSKIPSFPSHPIFQGFPSENNHGKFYRNVSANKKWGRSKDFKQAPGENDYRGYCCSVIIVRRLYSYSRARAYFHS